MPQSLMLLKAVTMPTAPPGWRSLWWILHHPDVLGPLEHLCSVDYGYSHSNCSLIDAKTPGILLELLLNSLPDQKQKKQTSRHFDFFGVWDHPSPSALHLLPKFRLYHAYTISVELVVSKGDGVFSHRFLFPSSCTLDPSFPGRLPMHPAVLRSAWKPEKRPEFLILFPMMEFSKVRVSILNDAYNIYSKAKSWILLTFT